MRDPNGHAKSVFSMPLDELERLPPEEFCWYALEAGVSEEKLRELLASACATKERALAKKLQAEEEERRLYYVRPHYRPLLKKMERSVGLVVMAQRLEQAAYRMLDNPGPEQEATQVRFRVAQRIFARHRFYKLCFEHQPKEALDILRNEMLNTASRISNIPQFEAIIRTCYKEVRDAVEDCAYQPSQHILPVEGPGEVFSVVLPVNYPRNPRPRRYNDSLDHD